MTEVTKEMILDYLIKKGGVVKNVDLVRHFRKYLQVENSALKDHAREVFKERVNSVASIRAEKGEKYLHLRPEYQHSASSARPPTGRTGLPSSERTSVSSIEDPPRSSLQNRDSLTQLISDLLSPTSTTSNFTDFGSTKPPSAQNSTPRSQSSAPHSHLSSSGTTITSGKSGTAESAMFSSRGGKNDVILQSYKPISSDSSSSYSRSSTATPSYRASSTATPTSSSSYSSPSAVASATKATPTSPTTSSSLFSPPATLSGLGGGMDLGSFSGDLMSSFGDLFSSFGASTSGLGGASTTSSGLGGASTTSSGLGGASTTSSGLGGLTTSDSSSLKYDSSTAMSTASYSSNTTTSSVPPVSTPAQNQTQRSPRRAPPAAPLGSQTSLTGMTGSSTSSAQGSPRRPPPGPPSGNRSSVTSIGSAGGLSVGVASLSSMKRSTSGSLSPQGSPRRPPPGPPTGTSTTGGHPSVPTSTTTASSSRRAPPPAPSPKTSTTSIGSIGGSSPSRNYNSNYDNSRNQSSSAMPGGGANYSKYGSPYHTHQQPSASSQGPARVMSPPRVTSPPKSSPSKVTSLPVSKATPTTGSSSTGGGTSSLGGLGTFDLGDLSSTFSSLGGLSFLDSSPKLDTPKAVPPPIAPQSSSGGRSSGPSTTSNYGTPTTASTVSGSAGIGSSNYASPSSTYSATGGPSNLSNITSPTGGTSSYSPASTHSGSSGPSSITSSKLPPTLQLGPTVSLPAGRGSTAVDGSGRRQRSIDRTQRQYNSNEALREQTPPTIRVHASPPHGSPDSVGMTSPGRDQRSKSPPYTSLGPSYDGRMRSHTSASHVTNGSVTNNLISSLGVQLRNKDGKQRGSQVPGARRSRNMDKRDPNLDSVTRLSIQMTPPTMRRSKPEVAPKPSPKPTHRSREDVSIDGDDVSMTEMSEQESWEIDPLEKDWMLACAQADLNGLQQLLMEEPNLINRKDFIHGYTALHWAAKHGRCDIIACLTLNGAQIDIKSNGLTPLHLAAQSGYDNAITQLIEDFGANANVRDHGGRRPIDMISNKTTERAKALLCEINNHGLPTRVYTPDHLLTFSQPHQKDGRLNRNWSSLGDMVDKKVEHEKSHKRLPRMASIRKSFSIHSKKKDYSPSKKDKSKRNTARPVSDAPAFNYRTSGIRPVSDAAAYSYNV